MAVVTIGLQIGSLGLELGRLLAQELRYQFVSPPEIIAEAARRYQLKPEQFQLVDERQPRFWERLRTDSIRISAYFRAVALESAAAGNAVIVGRSIPSLIPNGTREALKILAVSPVKTRIEQVMRSEKLDATAAERRVHHFDQEMRSWISLMQGMDIDDPANYDLVVNTGLRPLPQIAASVIALVKPIEQASDAISRQAVTDLCTSAQVRAALMAHPKIGHAAITVETEQGVVTLRSSSLVAPWDDLAVAVVRQVKGVKDVRLEVEVPPPPLRSE
jgi:cytidylate kinase